MWIYSSYITKNGVRIYPKDGKVFRFWVDDDTFPFFRCAAFLSCGRSVFACVTSA